MEDDRLDSPGVATPPPLVYLLSLVVGLLLNGVVPVRVFPNGLRLKLGLPFVGFGAVVMTLASRALRRAGTNVETHKPTTALVVGGPYRFARNPIYVALTSFYGGVAIVSNLLWALMLLPPLLIFMRHGVVEREERYLERKFGDEYLRYKARVPRWGIALPKSRLFLGRGSGDNSEEARN